MVQRIWLDYLKKNKEKLNAFANTWWLNSKDISEFKDTWSFNNQTQENLRNFQITPEIPKVEIWNTNTWLNWLGTNTPEKITTPVTPKITTPIPDNTTVNTWINAENITNKKIQAENEDLKKVQDDLWLIQIEDKNKIEKIWKTNIENTIKNFTISKWQYESKKDNFTNFDNINYIANSVISDLTGIIKTWNEPTDEQIRQIATKNWVTEEEVKNPQSIFNKLEFSEEWKTSVWDDTVENNLLDKEENLKRNKENAALNLKRFEEDTATSIADIERKITENIDWWIASWVWSWAMKSSWYKDWLNNIKEEWARNVSKLKTMLARAQSDDTENMEKLQADYDKEVLRINADLDSQMKSIKENAWLELNWLEYQYTDWEELKKKLNKIKDDIWTQTLASYNSYLDSYNKIQTIVWNNITKAEKIMELNEIQWNKRFNEYLAGDWALLRWTSLNDLKNDPNMPIDKLVDIKKIMSISIIDSLSWLWKVDTSDISTINTLLESWLTMQEVFTKMQWQEKFTPIVEDTTAQDRSKLDDNILYNERTWETKKILEQQIVWDTNSVDLISKWEWFRENAYQDIWGVWTVWHWFTTIDWKPVKEWDTITRWDSEVRLEKEVANRQNYLKSITVPLTDNQKAALSSFEYNLWSNIWNWEAKPIIDKINAWDFKWAAEFMKKFVNAWGKLSNWLVNRRNEEAWLLIKTEDNKESILNERKAFWLIQWLWWTAWERSVFMDNLIDTSSEDWSSLEEAKIKLWYKTDDDIIFLKERGWDFKKLKNKLFSDTKEARNTLILLDNPQTAIWDVATVVWFLKTIDPRSVARESEVEWVEKARSLLASMSVFFAKQKSWKKLTDEQREQIKTAITTIVSSADLKIQEEKEILTEESFDRWLNIESYIPKKEANKIIRSLKINRGTATDKEIKEQQDEFWIKPLWSAWVWLSTQLWMLKTTETKTEEQNLFDNY